MKAMVFLFSGRPSSGGSSSSRAQLLPPYRYLVAYGSYCHLHRGSAGGLSPEKIPSGAWGSLKEVRNSSEIQLTRLKRQAVACGGVGSGGHGHQESKERERN